MVGSYIFDASKGETPESAKRKRDIARALLQGGRAPQNVGEGLNALGDGIVAAVMNNRADRAERAGMDSANTAWGGIANLFGGGAEAAGGTPAAASSASSSGSGMRGDDIAWKDATPEQRAFLNTLAGPESGGRYNVIYGGGKFDNFADHPRQAVRIQTGPNAGRTSSAAGKYQFLGDTWDAEKAELGLPDFGPENQDKAAWNLAAKTYKQQTGNDLATVLQSGDPKAIASVGPALRGVWTSLPGGIEQGTNQDKFVSTYQRYLAAGASPAQAQAAATQETGAPAPNAPVQVASLDPAAGVQQPVPPAQGTPQPTAAAIASNGIANLGPGRPGEKKRGPDGRMYQYVETTGMAGADGANGWIPVDDAAAGVQQAMIEQGQDPNDALSQSLIQLKQNNPDGAPGPVVPLPQPAASRVTQALVQPQQVAQADMPMGGGVGAGPFPPAPPDPNSNRGRIAALLAASGNQWMPEGQQAIVKALIGEEMKKADPAYKMQLEKAALELEAMKNPKMSPYEAAQVEANKAKAAQEAAKLKFDQSDATADNAREDAKAGLDVSKFDYEKQKDALPEYYDAYVKQETAAGRQPLGILEYITATKKAAASNTSVTVGGGDNKQVFDAMNESAVSARSAATGLASLTEARKALDGGIISGTGADTRLGLQKLGAFLGVADPSVIVNTETFRSSIAPQVAALMKATVGSTQISNADREFAEKAAGGSINLDEGTIKRLVGIMDKAGRVVIQGHRERLEKVYPAAGGFERERALFGVDEPAPIAETPAATKVIGGKTYVKDANGDWYEQ